MTTEELRLHFWGKDDSRAYDDDEIKLMQEYGKQQWNAAIEAVIMERISIGDILFVPVEEIEKLKK